MLAWGTVFFHARVAPFMGTQHMISNVMHLLNPFLWEYDGILPSENYMILSSIILMLSDPSLLEWFKSLLMLLFNLFDPLWRRQSKQKLSMICQPANHILLLLYLAPYVNDLWLKVFVCHLHDFSLCGRPVGLPLFVMCWQLVLLYKLQQLIVVTLQLDSRVLESLGLPLVFKV